MYKIKELCKTQKLYIYITLLIALKIIIAGGLSIYVIMPAAHDDGLMVRSALNLLNGNWLGTYDNRTLVKGITFPIYLAINHILSIPYLISLILLYAAASITFVYTVRGLLKNRFMYGLLFTILFYSPIQVSVQTFMRVYRNSLMPSLTLFLFAFFIGMYLNRCNESFALWSIAAGVSLAAIWNLREDSIWVMPFVIIVCVVTIFTICFERKKAGAYMFCTNMVWAIIPLLICILVNVGICTVNYFAYGTFTRIELSSGNFPKLMAAISSVAPDEDILRLSVPKSTVDRLYEASPTFALLKEQLEKNYGGGWDASDGAVDGQIHDGWFFWCLRDCISSIGKFSTPVDMENLCEKAAQEINAAVKSGALPKRKGAVMPSMLMSPWRTNYFSLLPKTMMDTYWFVAKSDGCEIAPVPSVGNFSEIDQMESLTHNIALKPLNSVQLKGWLLSKDDDIPLNAALFKGDELFFELGQLESIDVYDHFLAGNLKLENAKTCRFDITFSVESTEKLTFAILSDDVLIEKIKLPTGTSHYNSSIFQLHIDNFLIQNPTTAMKNMMLPRISLLDFIHSIYRHGALLLNYLGLVTYGTITLMLAVQLRKNRTSAIFVPWLIITALIASEMVLIGGVAYTHISGYDAIKSGYLAGAYPLNLAFCTMSIIIACHLCTERWKQRRVKNEHNG